MSTEGNNSSNFKGLVGILSVLLIILAIYTVTLYNKSKETTMILQEQKGYIEDELEDLIVNYDEVILDNEIKDGDLLDARTRIAVLLDSVKDAKANIDLIRRYRYEIKKLKNERVVMFKQVDSLVAANNLLAAERDNTYIKLNESIQATETADIKNKQLAKKIEIGSVVSAVDLIGSAVIVRKSGKIVDTKRARRAEKVRACFTLTPNAITAKGDKTFYVQVIDPNNNLLGEKGELEFENGILGYSASTKVFYENNELDVCEMVNVGKGNLTKGTYVINVFDGLHLVATTTMTLK